MINHKHKCIFIHISKCAGTSIENAFGLLKQPVNKPDYTNLYGWCEKNKIFLQHATPQELLDLKLLKRETWDTYYKFIIIRDPWDRAYSDYVWMLKQIKSFDSFKRFLKKEGVFEKKLTLKNKYYRGDHLKQQYDYFQLDGDKIIYDKVIRFEDLSYELDFLEKKLNVKEGFFKQKKKESKRKFKHYSIFYNAAKRQLLKQYFSNDITEMGYTFNNKHTFSKSKNFLFLFYHFNFKLALKKYIRRGVEYVKYE